MEGRERAKTVFKKNQKRLYFQDICAFVSFSSDYCGVYCLQRVSGNILQVGMEYGNSRILRYAYKHKSFCHNRRIKVFENKGERRKKTRKKKKILLGSQLAAVFCRPCFNRPRFHDGATAKRNRLYRNTRDCHGGIHNLQNRIFRQKFC